jgi:hypothetical protein
MAPSNHALEVSKRKFYKLLDNLSTPRVDLHDKEDDNNASKAAVATEPANKRLKKLGKSRPLTAPPTGSRPFSVAGERPGVSVRAVHGTTSPARPVSEYETPMNERRPVNYVPWDHEKFLARLKTFSNVMTWTPKPSIISEVEWAKRGWVVVAKDTVGCKGGCEKQLYVTMGPEATDLQVQQKENAQDGETGGAKSKPSSPAGTEGADNWWMANIENELAEKYRDLIVEGHDVDCMWRKNGCKDDIYRIKMADPLIWQKELRERYLSLMTVASSLPDTWTILGEDSTNIQTPDMDELAKCLPIDIFKPKPLSGQQKEAGNPAEVSPEVEITSVSTRDPPNSTALSLALCGWSGQSPHGVELAFCTKCFQRIGLWLYRFDPNKPSSEVMTFNPVELHREYCPWKNVTTQASVGTLAGLAGWEVLVKLVKAGRRRFGVKDDTKEVKNERKSGDWSGSEDETPRQSREEMEAEDKARRSKIQRLKRVFSVKKKDKDKTVK